MDNKFIKCLLIQRVNKQVDAIDPEQPRCLFNLHAVNGAVITGGRVTAAEYYIKVHIITVTLSVFLSLYK